MEDDRDELQDRHIATSTTATDPPARNSEFVQSLARGLAVLESFQGDHLRMTLTEVAEATGLHRGTTRRLLLTLVALGYVHSEGRYFTPTARVMDLGYSYLSRHRMWEPVRPVLADLVARTRETSSIAVLDGHEVMYALRVHTDRIMSIRLDVGARLPAFATSTGRVLLAGLPDNDLDVYLDAVDRPAFTPQTVTDADALRAVLAGIREQGWALVDQEMELGVRSLAVPLRNPSGRTVASVNVAAHAGRISGEQMLTEILDPLRETARIIESQLLDTGPPRPPTER